MLCLMVLLTVVLPSARTVPNAPKFIPTGLQPAGSYTRMDYYWGAAVPVQGGKMWISAASGPTNHHQFLYDLDKRVTIGELSNASAVFFNGDQTKLLCEGFGSPAVSLKWRIMAWLKNFAVGKALAQKVNRDEAFWVLDLKNNSAKRIGKLTQSAGSGSHFVPSPGFRYGYNQPSASLGTGDFVLCDLESNIFTRIKLDGDLKGWWDDQNILFKDSGNNFIRFDVGTRQTNTLFSAEAIAKLLEQMGLPRDPAGIGVFCTWNGSDYDVYFTQQKEKSWGESFLLKADRSGNTLKLIHRDFKFEWLGKLDAEGTHYLYQGERGQPGQGGNGGVFLRDLTDNSTRTLVEPDNGGQYALARFCGDGVIYSRKGILWRVNLDGTDNGPIFAKPQ
jgi:hypothetical protein